MPTSASTPKKVLVVDDSALMRKVLREVLTDAGFQVEAARSGMEGVDLAQQFLPDVVTMDINMPEMDGLTALSLLMSIRPTPVVMVSSLTQQGTISTLEALALGAVDYVAKPGGTISLNLREISDELVRKVRTASTARVRAGVRAPGSGQATALKRAPYRGRAAQDTAAAMQASDPRHMPAPATQRSARGAGPVVSVPAPAARMGLPDGLVVIGVSTGGPRTLEEVLPRLPADFPWPVLVAQHMPPHFTGAFAQRMDQMCALQVRECNAPMPLQAGQILVAQGGFDMVVVERLGRLLAQPAPEARGYPWHPCVDVLVDSVMQHMPADRVVGVLLTGMGDDGAGSMTRLRQRGGHTIAESAETAVVYGMPQELVNRDGAECVLPAPRVTDQLLRWARLH